MTRIKVNAVLAGIGIAILGASATPAIAHAEDTPAGELTTETAEPPAEEPATMWDKTRDVSEDAWDATKEGSARAWDKTKERPRKSPLMPGMPPRKAAPRPGTRPRAWFRASRKPVNIRKPRQRPASHPDPDTAVVNGK